MKIWRDKGVSWIRDKGGSGILPSVADERDFFLPSPKPEEPMRFWVTARVAHFRGTDRASLLC